jgi:hypothetical protein
MMVVKSIAASAFMIASVAAFAQGDQLTRSDDGAIRVLVDGQRVHFRDMQPREINGRVMVPLRGVFEKMGAHVGWDPSSETVSADKEGSHVQITIGQLDASVNGQSIRMDVPAKLVDGVTMVPLRFITEALGGYVGWDQQDKEVSITSSRDYKIPRHDNPPPTPPPVTPPPVIVSPPPTPPPTVIDRRPLRIVRTYDEIKADSVIPLVLETRLSSRDSKPGDPFTARLDTHGDHGYMNLPVGTKVYGTVAYVKRQHRRVPGVIELRFDHMTTPNGRSLPINGRLYSLDDTSVTRSHDGDLIAAKEQRNNTVVFVAYDNHESWIVSLPTERPLRDSEIPNLLGQALEASQRSRLAHDVELRAGTPMGLRLYGSLVIPRD